jgi:hypothetical protein
MLRPNRITIDDGDRLTGSRPPPPRSWLEEDGMHPRHFDRLTLALSTTGSRRIALRALLSATALSVAGGQRVNAQACTPNGQRCGRPTDLQCCSGLCKRKQGSQKKYCRKADHQGTCDIEQDGCLGGVTCNGNVQCNCFVTTTGRSFCGGSLSCTACTSDAECKPVMGKGSKCVQCAAICSGIDTFCAAPC